MSHNTILAPFLPMVRKGGMIKGWRSEAITTPPWSVISDGGRNANKKQRSDGPLFFIQFQTFRSNRARFPGTLHA